MRNDFVCFWSKTLRIETWYFLFDLDRSICLNLICTSCIVNIGSQWFLPVLLPRANSARLPTPNYCPLFNPLFPFHLFPPLSSEHPSISNGSSEWPRVNGSHFVSRGEKWYGLQHNEPSCCCREARSDRFILVSVWQKSGGVVDWWLFYEGSVCLATDSC